MAFDISEVFKDVSVPDTGKDVIQYLPYANIIPDPNNGYSMDGIEDLARSIELVGLQQPPRVRLLADNTVQILSGHRRYAAIGLIIDQNPNAFPDGIPCIIDRREGSAALQELKLILGNADNRKLTAADEAQQLERMSDCIRRLEAEGWTFPGRHRDWLSKMSGMSKSKIGRLEAIQKHLSTTWLKLFSSGKLPESVAYAMQQIPEKYQEILYDLCVSSKPRVAPASLIEYTVKSFAQSVTNAESMVCTVDGSGEPCVWKEQLITTGNRRPGWVVHYGRCSSYNRCSACCSTCDRLAVCETVCPKMREKAQTLAVEKEKKDAAKKAERAAQREQSRKEFEERHRKEQEILDGIWKRMGERRRELGLSVQSAYLQDDVDEEDMEDIERLETEGGADEDPFSFFDLYKPEDLCSLADRLQCSLDYLYGRSETPQSVSNPDTPLTQPARDLEAATFFRSDGKLSVDGIYTALDWQTGTPLDDGRYLCLVDMNVGKLHEQRCKYRDGKWLAYGEPLHDMFAVKAWWPLPPEMCWLPHEVPEEEDEDNA